MIEKLWEASKKQKKNSLLFKFEQLASKKFNKNFNNSYHKILKWSVKNQGDFWSLIWDFSNINGKKSKNKLKKSKIFYKNLFLPGSKLNFAENLLPKNNQDKLQRDHFFLFLFFVRT